MILFSSYKNDPQIVAMTNLVGAYQRKEIREFVKILRGKMRFSYVDLRLKCYTDEQQYLLYKKDNRATIMHDPFIRTYIDDVLKNIHTQVLLRLIKPYTRIEIPFVSKVWLLFLCKIYLYQMVSVMY